ncbi:MAG TPA: four helix bundle protein [Kofleriaceae bacterium]|nr:four helix bundle protein [Kofleriaceae bacterium]
MRSALTRATADSFCRHRRHAQLPATRCLPARDRAYALSIDLVSKLPRGHAVIADQLRRASLSVPLNIAEGAGRTSLAEAAKHYAIARGSAMECAAIFDAMRVLTCIEPKLYETASGLVERVVAMLTKLHTSTTGETH